MTALLASVRNLQEARLVARCGANIIDLKEPSLGALGALSPASIESIVSGLDGILPVSATIGDVPFSVEGIEAPLSSIADSGVDIIKVGVFTEVDDPGALALLSRFAGQGKRLVLVFFAENYPPKLDFTALADLGIHGVMLDTMEKSTGNLCEKLSQLELENFCNVSRKQGLLCGLAGSIGAIEIPALLSLNPDYLGFRGALCAAAQRSGAVDEVATREIRQLIPEKLQNTEKRLSIL